VDADAITATLIMLHLFFRRDIPATYDVSAEDACQCDQGSGNLQGGLDCPVIAASRFLCSGASGDPGHFDTVLLSDNILHA
jgi:hypothetical protein